MISDILYKSDILYGLFTQKDFEFLQNSNNRQEEIEFQLKMADLKRDNIVEAIKKIEVNEASSNTNTVELKKYVESAESAFESINCIIKNLTSLQDDFNDIEKDILELIVKKEANRNINSFEAVDNINRKIAKFKEKQNQINSENNKCKAIVESFLSGSQTSFNTSNSSPVHTEQSVEQFYNKPSKTVYSHLDNKDLKDNLVLTISEKQKRVYLPYTKTEIENLLKNYPNDYKDAKDVIEQEFVADISIYNKHPVLARFREAYSLSRNKEMKSAIDSLKYAMELMFRSDINPTIIAAVKSQKQLEDYIQCLENNTLDSFPHFTIIFEVNPI